VLLLAQPLRVLGLWRGANPSRRLVSAFLLLYAGKVVVALVAGAYPGLSVTELSAWATCCQRCWWRRSGRARASLACSPHRGVVALWRALWHRHEPRARPRRAVPAWRVAAPPSWTCPGPRHGAGLGQHPVVVTTPSLAAHDSLPQISPLSAPCYAQRPASSSTVPVRLLATPASWSIASSTARPSRSTSRRHPHLRGFGTVVLWPRGGSDPRGSLRQKRAYGCARCGSSGTRDLGPPRARCRHRSHGTARPSRRRPGRAVAVARATLRAASP